MEDWQVPPFRWAAGEDDRNESPAALEETQPTEQLERALGIETGRARLETVLQSLPGQAEQSGQLGLGPVFPQVWSNLVDKFIP